MSTKGFAVNLQSNISKVSYSSQVQTVSEAEQQNSFSSIMSQTQNTEEDKSLVPCATSNISEKKQVKKYENDYAVSQSNSQLRDSAKNGSIQTKELTVKETGTEELSYEAKLKETLMKVLGVSEEELEEMLAELGLTMMDLFTPQNLTELVLMKFDATDVSDALLNEELASALKDCLGELQELIIDMNAPVPSLPQLEEAGNMESFDEVMENAKAETSTETSINSTTVEEIKVTVESSKEFEQSSSNQESKDGMNQQEGFVDFFTNQIDASSLNEVTQTADVVTVKEIVTQLVEQIKINISQTNTSMELMLNPENLGKVQLLVSSKNGVLTAQMTVDNMITKEAIESSINTLKETFAEQGLKVEEVEVTIGNYSSEYDEQRNEEQQKEQKGSKRKLNLDDAELASRLTTEETVESEPVNMMGSVSYTA